MELPSAADLDLAVDRHELGSEQALDIAALVDGIGKLEKLAEPNGLAADRDVMNTHLTILPVSPPLTTTPATDASLNGCRGRG